MSRMTLMLWAFTCAVTVFLLYQVRYKVQDVEEDIARTEQHIIQERESMHVLNAEWTYLTRPERLQALIERYGNGMTAMSPEQIVQVADLPNQMITPVPVQGKPDAPMFAQNENVIHTAVVSEKTKPVLKVPAQAKAQPQAPKMRSVWDVVDMPEATAANQEWR